ncbi:MAG: PD-(D/E)XK nuclease family protein [Clostridia bacterium]|nr:PD-(D/E)XK nuclease family protein [Clostridia bacterium]
MLELLCGAPGSGKTEYLIERAAKTLTDDPRARILFIVPEQETVSAESRIFSRLPHYAPLTVEVDNFSRLADSVFRRVGGVARDHVGKSAKKLCMWKTLKLLSPSACTYEAVNSTLALASELLTGGATPEKLAAAADRLENEERLAELLREYSRITSIYSAFTDEIGNDSMKDLASLGEILAKERIFADTEICIDGFTSFTGIEYEIISLLADQAKKVTVTLGGDPHASDIRTAEIRECAATLTLGEERVGRKPVCISMENNKRTMAPDLRKLCEDLWRQGANACDHSPDGILLIKCRTPMDEAEFTAREIARLVRDGARYSDIAITVRDAESWRGILDALLEDHGIPAFISAGDKLEEHPAVRFLCRAASAADLGRDNISAMLKTGFTSLSSDDCDVYVKYANTWKIGPKDLSHDGDWTMEPDGFVMHSGGKAGRRAAATLAAVNRVRRALRELLLPLREDLSGSCTVKDACRAVFLLAERAKLRQKLKSAASAARAEGNEREAERCARVWNSILAALDTAVACAGEEEIKADELPVLMRLIFSDTSLSSIPTSADAVTVGSADMLRTTGVRYMFILGACEGEFPASVNGKGFLSQREKNLLEKEGIRLSKDVNTLASRELYIMLRAISYARDAVTITYHGRDMRGSECVAGSAVTNIKKLFPLITEEDGSALLNSPSGIWDKKSAERALSIGGGTASVAAGIALGKEDATTTEKVFALEKDTCDKLFGETVDLTQTRIETYAKCHFMYFCRYILDIQPEAMAEFSYSSNGTYIHAMLEKLIPVMQESSLSPEELKDRIEKLSEEYFNALIPERDRDDPRLTAQFERMKNAVRPIATALGDELAASEFTPIGTEIPISESDEALPRPLRLPLENGRVLRIFGTVDRADALHCGEDTFVRVIDYKTNDKAFRLKNVDEGVNLQLLIYLLTLCKDKNKGFLEAAGSGEKGLSPGGMLYCVTKPPEKQVNAPPSEEEYGQMVNGAATVRGIVINTPAVTDATDKRSLAAFSPVEDGKDSDRMLLSPEEFEALGKKTEAKMAKMASSLARGNIAPEAELGESLACQYCDYHSLCGKIKEGGRH